MINESGILNINTKNLIYNYNFFKKLKKNLIVAPTIKANAYGLGDKKIYNLLLNQGCKHFFVATLSEGLKLNNKNKLIKIYVLNGLQNYKLHKFTNANLIPVVNTIDEYNRIKNTKIEYAIHIDTGINRLGISSKDVKMLDLKNQNIKLVISHLSSSDEYKIKYNIKQKEHFNKNKKNEKTKEITNKPKNENSEYDYDFDGIIPIEGVIEILPDGYGFIRSSDYHYLTSPDDIYVSQSQIKLLGLKTGDTIEGNVRPPKSGEKYFPLIKVQKINGKSPNIVRDRVPFEHLTPLFPFEKFNVIGNGHNKTSTRMLDLFTPIG